MKPHLVCFLLLTSCSVFGPPITPEEIAAADIGPAPEITPELQRHHEALILETLKDPESAHFRHGQPRRIAWETGSGVTFAIFNHASVGWLAPVEVNAKNSFGGYTGYQTQGFVYIHDTLVGSYHDGLVTIFSQDSTP